MQLESRLSKILMLHIKLLNGEPLDANAWKIEMHQYPKGIDVLNELEVKME